MVKPLTAGEKIARDLCEMDAPIDNIIEVDPVDVARRIDEEVFSILDILADCAFRNERLVSDYASVQEELSSVRRIHAQNIAIKDAEIARWKTVPMKYRRMAFNAQLQDECRELRQQLAASQLEAKRLWEAIDSAINGLRWWMDAFPLHVTEEDNEELLKLVKALSTPFTPTVLNELIEKAEKMTIERCAGVCKTLDRKEKRHAAGYGPGYLTHTASDCEQIIRAIPTGQIKLEDLL